MNSAPTIPCKLCTEPTQDLAGSICDACWGMTHSAIHRRWLPMETAPKDGTEVLVKADDGVRIVRFDRFWQDARTAEDVYPTGWRPLPEV